MFYLGDFIRVINVKCYLYIYILITIHSLHYQTFKTCCHLSNAIKNDSLKVPESAKPTDTHLHKKSRLSQNCMCLDEEKLAIPD